MAKIPPRQVITASIISIVSYPVIITPVTIPGLKGKVVAQLARLRGGFADWALKENRRLSFKAGGGDWRSPVARTVRDGEVGGSNPPSPTTSFGTH